MNYKIYSLKNSILFTLFFSIVSLKANTQIINTIAGGIVFGDGGLATNASFAHSSGVAVDGAGNIYIADEDDTRNKIRKININGIINTIAGNGSAGFGGDGGLAINASLNSPSGIALDGAGNIYIADWFNNRVRKVNSSGVISTIAGDGSAGYAGDGGLAIVASLNYPTGVAVDGAGNVYIADCNNNRIRKVNSSGIINTIAGNGIAGFGGDGGTAINASLKNPTGLVLDGVGNIYIADCDNGRIRKVNISGVIITVAGGASYTYGGDSGLATSALLHYPTGLAVDGIGNIFIADFRNNRIRKVNSIGIISTAAGSSDSGYYGGDGDLATNAFLKLPTGVAIDGLGNIYIVDSKNNRIRKVDSNGIINTIAGNGSFGFGGDGGLATSAILKNPTGVTVDAAGNIYIVDQGNSRVRKVNINGIISTIAGNGIAGFGGDGGLATNALLNNPTGINFDGLGNLYITDYSNNRIRKVGSNGIISTVAGNGNVGYGGDGGLATTAILNRPFGLAIDGVGNIFIADVGNNRIRKIDINGIISTIAGTDSIGVYYGGDGGVATRALLNSPFGVAVSSSGNILYIADAGNNRIREVTLPVGALISGNIKSPLTKAIKNVSVNYSGNSIGNIISDSIGDYSLSLNIGNYTITPSKNNDINKTNGVTTLDLAFVQSHILGKNKLNNPYKIIAADVNGDSKITTLDLVYMKRLILGIDTTFTNSSTKENRLWAFVDSSYSFPDTTNPFPFKDSISYIGLNANKTNQTFIGVKLGDVNWDWNPALARTPSKVFVRPKKFVINN